MSERLLRISIADQRLQLLQDGRLVGDYPVSTAANGPGQALGSGCTPLGKHRIRIRIGDGCPPGSVFVGRRATGEIYSTALAAAQPQRDWVLTRILWLTGVESGINRGGRVDTLKRYIYIHGTPPTEPMGVPRSHGCIRMRDVDLLSLFDRVRAGDAVEILP